MAWVRPLAIGAVFFYLGVHFVAWRSGRVKATGLAVGFVVFPLAISLGTPGALGLWRLLNLTGVRADGDAISTPVAALLLVAALVVFIAPYALLWDRVGICALDLGALAWWAVLTVVSAWSLPEGSFGPLWPLGFRLATTALAWRVPWRSAAIMLGDLGTLPAFTIVGAGAYAMLASLSPASVSMALSVALFVPGAILPQLWRLSRVLTAGPTHQA